MDKIAALTEILEHNPTDAFARYGLAMARTAAGDTDQALAEYTTLLEHTPNYVPAYQMSAQSLVRLGRTSEAVDRLRTGVQIAEQTGNAHAQAEMQAMLDDLGL